MKIIWLTAACVVSAMVFAMRFGPEVWLGMGAPLVVAGTTWLWTERVYRTHPGRLTSMMIAAFAGKLVFFGVYVGVAIGVADVRPVPFTVSFAGYFIALHVIEALWLKRLFIS